MKYLEDIRIGETVEFGRHTFTAAEIKSFAERYDPQPFHLDEAAAVCSHFGALVASGWHTGSVCIRLMIEHRLRQEEAMRARGEPVGRTGPSPGFRDLKWLKPVYAGDTITYASEVIEAREVRSRPDKGIVSALNTGTNQAGELVFSFVSVVFVDRRPNEKA
jgi:acyl dehydratase